MLSLTNLEIFRREYLNQWCILLGSLIVALYFIQNSSVKAQNFLTLNDVTHVRGMFKSVECLKGSSRSVDSLLFSFETHDGEILTMESTINSTKRCHHQVVRQLVANPVSKGAELWFYQNDVLGMMFGDEFLVEPSTGVNLYNRVHHSYFFEWLLLISLNFVNFIRWLGKRRQLKAI